MLHDQEKTLESLTVSEAGDENSTEKENSFQRRQRIYRKLNIAEAKLATNN